MSPRGPRLVQFNLEGKGSLHMQLHILSLDGRHDQKHKKSLTRSFEQRPDLFCVERKQRPNCWLEFSFWFRIIFFSLFCLQFRMVPHGADSLCVCVCSVFERWHAKGQWRRPGHICLNTLRPSTTTCLLPSPNPSNSPCGREQHDSGTPLPGPKLHARFFCSVRFVFSVCFSTFL